MMHSGTWWEVMLPATGLSMMAACVLTIDYRDGELEAVEPEAPLRLSSQYEADTFNFPEPPVEPRMETAATYEGVFNCTIYYTPMESGFTAGEGYDVTLVTKPGLNGRTYAQDFLKAVRLEGFGRIREPVAGCRYIKFDGTAWGFVPYPVDRSGRPLVAMSSSAIAANHKLLRPQNRFRIKAEGLPSPFIKASWTVSDTGSGLGPDQIDCYWGEDAPLGPGKLSRPKGMPMGIVKPLVMVLK